jgi:CubicO group peptidase (beta-lactamase class C family)
MTGLVHGEAAPGFEGVCDAFAENLASAGEVGASVCIYHRGAKVVDLWGGFADPAAGRPYGKEDCQVVFSTSKGLLAVCAHLLAQRGAIDLDAPVARYWPEFAAAGKESLPLRWVISHRAGLVGIERPVSWDDVLAGTPVLESLAAQAPLWEPGTAHGYHPLSAGFIFGEVVRRVTGSTVGRFFADEVAEPLGLQAWIGLPAEREGLVAPLFDFPPERPDEFFTGAKDEGTIASKAFTNPTIEIDRFNEAATRQAEVPAANAIVDARSLARLYAACIGPIDGVRLLEEETMEDARAVQAEGQDMVLPQYTSYGSGFMLPMPWLRMAGPGSFGHDGLGGSLGFASPERELAFGYVMNQCLSYIDGDPRSERLVDATLECLGSAS